WITHSLLMRGETAWAAFQKARETDGFIVLHLARAYIVAVPLREMTPEQRSELRTFLRGKGLLPGGEPAPAVS
ncbi:MAG TPA: YcxB family protein, partial [Pseudonocardia sp.]|nr:YcxB family protein [Pseudonocardia sp.]